LFNLALKNIIFAILGLQFSSTLALGTCKTHFINISKIVVNTTAVMELPFRKENNMKCEGHTKQNPKT